MVCLRSFASLFIFVLWSIVKGDFLSPWDIRIDHYKVDITRDLIINTARPKFSWKIPLPDDKFDRNVYQTAYQIQIESTKLTKKDQLFVWDSERVQSSESIHVQYTNQMNLLPSTYYQFRVRVWTTNSNESSQWTRWIQFRTAIFNLHEYFLENSNAIWIGSRKINMNELRKEFNVPNTSPVNSAIVYISGIGYYQFYLNGQKVDPTRKLDPGWTSYEKRTLMSSYDLTPNITTGTNAIGVQLGRGWFSQEQHGGPNYGPPRLLFSLIIKLNNGDQIDVVSDQTWIGRAGSIKHDSVYNGEFYDSRDDRANWTRPGFVDPLSTWIAADPMPSPFNSSMNNSLVLQDMLPIRLGPDALHFEVNTNNQQQGYLSPEEIGDIHGANLTDGGILKPIARWKSSSDVQTFDMGQNMAGLCRLRFNGSLGFGTYIRYGEILTKPDIASNVSTRNIYTENLRDATASDTYILYGNPDGEIYEPSFTYHGFRYVSIFGPPQEMTLDDLNCSFIHSETTLKGHFTSSNEIINQIQHNIQWGQLSNLMSLPTDCAQRDERRGWMGDAALTANEALFNFDLIKFYQNFLNLIVDDQLDDGQLPNWIPVGNGPSDPGWGGNYPPDLNWGTALPTITWQVYRHYNDIQTLKDYYDPIVAYVRYIHGIYNTTGLANITDRYGDWVPPPPHSMTNRKLIASFAFLHDVNLLVNMSQILGKQNDTDFYSRFYQQLCQEFHQVFYNTSFNYYADGMQAAQVLALALPNLVPTNVRQSVLNQLVNDINQQGIHVTTGIVSNAQIYPILSDNGHHDLALQLVSSITYPSYGYMFNNPFENATTILERWNTPTADPGMNARNQAMFSSVGAWFYSHLAGIDLHSNLITIRPRMPSESKKHLMSKLNCQLSTLYGIVQVSYTRHERDTAPNSILLNVIIPANTQARVMFEPLFLGAQCNTLMENNQIIWSSNSNITSIDKFTIEKDSTTNLMIVHIGSGQYHFQAFWQ